MSGRRERRRPQRLAVAAVAAAALAAVLLMTGSDSAAIADPPRILVSLDDSLVQRLGLGRLTYARSVRRAGGRPVVVDYRAWIERAEPPAAPFRVERRRIAELVASIDGLLLSGGGDVAPGRYGGAAAGVDVDPARDAFEIAVLEEATRLGRPILAICRGAQLLNVLRGGTLEDFRHDPVRRRRHRSLRAHAVRIAPESRLAELAGGPRLERVFSWHGQAVERPGEGLRVVAWAEDGVVEAVETVEPGGAPWLLAVQWHPELRPRDPHHRRLFAELVRQAASSRE